MRNLPVNKKLKSSNENVTITMIMWSLELHWLPWSPGGLTSLFNCLFEEGSVEFRVSHTTYHWPLRTPDVQCWVCSDRTLTWGFLSFLPESTSDGDASHFLLGSLFPWFSDEKAWLDNLPIIRLFKPVCDLHFSKWGASS